MKRVTYLIDNIAADFPVHLHPTHISHSIWYDMNNFETLSYFVLLFARFIVLCFVCASFKKKIEQQLQHPAILCNPPWKKSPRALEFLIWFGFIIFFFIFIIMWPYHCVISQTYRDIFFLDVVFYGFFLILRVPCSFFLTPCKRLV